MNTLIDRCNIDRNIDFTKFFFAKFQNGDAYRGGAYKKACIVAHLTLSFYLYKSNCNISKFGQNLAFNAFSSRDTLC